jgi:hypothetical protein
MNYINQTQNKTETKNPWQALIQTSVLGSGRRDAALDIDGPIGELLAGCEANRREIDTRENQILTALAAVSIARRAGQTGLDAELLPPAPPICPPPSGEFSSFRSLTLLNQILADQAKGGEARRQSLLGDWLNFCNDAGRTIMPSHLPRIIETLGNTSDLHSRLFACGGPALTWLIAQNPNWQESYKSSLGTADVSELSESEVQDLILGLELGVESERHSALILLHKYAPEAALASLRSLWEKEPIEIKLGFVRIIGRDRKAIDEDFLEEFALNDRRNEIRKAAAEYLVTLPGSRLTVRMEARAAAFIAGAENLSEKAYGEAAGAIKSLVITLPEAFDKAMAKDGIDENLSIDSRVGQKAAWLYQVIASVNPSFWPRHTGLSPEQFVDMVLKDKDWSLPVVLGLLSACARFRDSAMQDAIIARDEIHLSETLPGRAFLYSLPQEKFENLVLQKLPRWLPGNKQSAPRLDIWYYLELVDCQWSENFSQTLAKFIIKELREKVPVFGHTFYSNATVFGLRMHVGAASLLASINLAYEEVDTWTRNGLERFIDNVKLREEIRRSFLEEPDNE